MKDQEKFEKSWTRRDFIKTTSLGVGALAMGLPKGFAFAVENTFPTNPIDIICPFSVGGGTDIWLRAFSVALASKDSLNVPVNVNNIPGAATLRGVGQAFAAKPDGYTLVGFNPPSTPWSWFLHEPSFDIEKFTGISVYAKEPGLLVVNSNSAYRDFQSVFTAYNDGKLKILGSLGIGTVWHIASLLMKKRAGVNWEQYVSYKGTSDVIAALYRNEIEVGIITATSAADPVAEGRLRVLAVLGLEDRLASFPDAPTFKELGKDPLSETILVRGVYGPPDMPEKIQKTLESAFMKAQNNTTIQENYKSQKMTPAYGDGASAQQAILNSIKVAKEIDLKSIVKESKK